MKYYIGRIEVRDGMNQYDADACIVAKNDAQAQQLLETRAQMYGGDDAGEPFDGWYGFNGDTVATRAGRLTEISAHTFSEMQKLLPVFGDSVIGDLAEESADQRARTLASRIGNQLKKLDQTVPHSKLLHAVAASLGESDWQVLVHRKEQHEAAPDRAQLAGEWPANGETQPYIPGSGYLYRVPVTVDTTMTAFVLVRARDEQEAKSLATTFAAEGNAKFEVDDCNYRGPADHYIGDPSSVERMVDTAAPLPETVEVDSMYIQRGVYKVSLTDLGDRDDALLWADLEVFDANEEEPEAVSCLSGCPSDASEAEVRAFCLRIAELFQRGAPDPSKVDRRTLEHVFITAAQSDLPDNVLEAKLRDGSLD